MSKFQLKALTQTVTIMFFPENLLSEKWQISSPKSVFIGEQNIVTREKCSQTNENY